jgi:endonuclease/exonuclease/phosphatase family metal-dependent hydrolase
VLTNTQAQTNSSGRIDHQLGPFFPELSRFDSSAALQASDLYARLEPEIERVLKTVVQEDFAPAISSDRSSIRAAAWNIERGTHVEGVVRVLREHPLLQKSDILLLTELDLGMARSSNRLVAQEVAQALKLNYAFAPCYIALNKGSGLESEVPGENSQALHGNALFSRFPLREAHSIAMPNGKDLMWGKEKRLGYQQAVVATIDHPRGPVRVVSLHLDAHSTQKHRYRQMKIVLDHLEKLDPSLPVLIGGDWNTSTYNSSRVASRSDWWRLEYLDLQFQSSPLFDPGLLQARVDGCASCC